MRECGASHSVMMAERSRGTSAQQHPPHFHRLPRPYLRSLKPEIPEIIRVPEAAVPQPEFVEGRCLAILFFTRIESRGLSIGNWEWAQSQYCT